jgi:hypothetical protein
MTFTCFYVILVLSDKMQIGSRFLTGISNYSKSFLGAFLVFGLLSFSGTGSIRSTSVSPAKTELHEQLRIRISGTSILFLNQTSPPSVPSHINCLTVTASAIQTQLRIFSVERFLSTEKLGIHCKSTTQSEDMPHSS